MFPRRLEQRHEPLIPRGKFVLRLLHFLLIGVAVDFVLIGIGTVGFCSFESLDWLDAALVTAMIITGNGPPYQAVTPAGKIFQIIYGILGVIVFVLVLSLVLIPVFHRVLHRYLREVERDEDEAAPPR